MNQNAKILIADDSEFMRKILRDILEADGFSNIMECADGKECLEKFEAEKPDLILLDIIMPNLDGMGVLKEIGTKTKIVVISSVGQEKMIEETKSLGVLDYIVKPFEKKKVVEKIKKVLETE